MKTIVELLREFARYHSVCNQWDETGEYCLRDVVLAAAGEIEEYTREASETR